MLYSVNDRLSGRRWFDNFLRFLDLTVQRFDAGTALEKWLHLERHTITSYLWPALVCTAVLVGMPVLSGWRFLAAVTTLIVSVLVLLLTARFTLKRSFVWDAVLQAGLVLACCAVVALIGEKQVPKEGGLYLHALVPLAAIFALSILGAAWVTPRCFEEHTTTTSYPEGIEQTQLFQRRPPPTAVGWGTVLQGIALALARVPELLFPPCVFALLVPQGYVYWTAAVALVPLAMLTVAGLDERIEEILSQLSSPFFRNGALLITSLVIALGLARWKGISYVSTVLDTAAAIQVAIVLAFAYAMVWWQDYWIARLAGHEMLRIAGGSNVAPTDVGIDYPFKGDNQDSRVPADGRRIQLHGLGRFLVLRPDTLDRSSNREQPPWWIGQRYPAFHTWTFSDFFAHVASRAHPNGEARPSPMRIAHRLSQHATIVRLLTGAAIALGIWCLSLDVQEASALATSPKSGSVSLAELIKSRPADRPVILVAASGGGTRAALFTAAVLEGLKETGAIEDVVLGSGVSGGGASLAYFAAQRHALNWDTYFDVMQTAYIRDVLERSSEWRMFAGQRLGILLDESFDRHWRMSKARRELGQVLDMGLILNTAIAGHYAPNEEADLEGGKDAFAATASKHFDAHQTTLAGGRLILTNLNTGSMFEGVNGPYPTGLPVVVNDPKFPLSSAAALNANFPPVFSNAPIDVDGHRRYWVTDGGAADNRGVEMLLYALSDARKNPEVRARRAVVVIADASAAPGGYSQDRGVGSAMGAGTQFAMHLVAELHRDMADNVQLLYLPMPRVLSKSFGTHWMLQETVEVQVTKGTDQVETVRVEGKSMVEVLRALYANGSCDAVERESPRRACEAALGSKEMRESWEQVRAALVRKRIQ